MATVTRINGDELEAIAAAADVAVTYDNYVGALQEAAVGRGVPAPQYQFGRVGGTPHAPEFTCVCVVAGVGAPGKGRSKQTAKQAAAKAWIDRLSE